MTQEEYIQLYRKHLAGECTPQEEELLLDYKDNFELLDLPWDESQMGKQQETKQEIFAGLESHMRYSIQPETKRTTRLSFAAIAAVITLLIASAGAYFWIKQKDKQDMVADAKTEQLRYDVAPGGDKAILTLADGSTIVLDSARNGELSQQGATTVIKLDGQLAYNAPENAGSKVLYNTISTPRGGQYQVVLPDGTKVWLNAASSLRFPTAFTTKERRVELTGEAYFEVAKDKSKPFMVSVQNMQVEVLGTHFNIMAYGEENSIRTTLLEGAVKIGRAGEHIVLEPGQQAVVAKGADGVKVVAANTDEAVAWKNGYFMFENESIESIMRKVSRWYNVDVQYQGNVENMNFVGKISRYENVSEVLTMLELTGTVHFKVEERRVTVMP